MKRMLLMRAGQLAIILGLLIPVPVSAQGSTGTQAPGTWSSSINLQNTGTSAANVVLNFYDSSGSLVLAFSVTPTIPAGGSRSLFVPTDVTGLADGQFSVVVSSDQPMQAVANSSSSSPATAGAYTGLQVNEVGTNLFFPGLYKSYFGFDSEVALQNTESTDASVTLKFYKQATGGLVATVGPVIIPATSTRIFALQDLAGVPSGNTDGLLSAQVTSDKILAGIANLWSSAFDGEFGDYNGYVSGSTSVVYAPALYNEFFGFVSALTIQNVSSGGNADIKVTYSNGETETKTLLPFQAVEYFQPNNSALPSGNVDGVFSAKIESLNAAPIVALVTVEEKTRGLLASYNGPSLASGTSICPVVLKSFFQWFSAQTVQNVGTAPTDITIEYATGESKVFTNVPANGTVNIIELDATGSVLPDGSSVAAEITSSGEPIVAVVQENSNERYAGTPGDYLLAYTCVSN